MEAFLVSAGAVTLAEIGDKTQLLAIVLAARFRKPWPIVAGILAATLVNHACAGAVGAWLTALISPGALRWILGVSFVAMAIWVLFPDKFQDEDSGAKQRWGIFGTTAATFFLAEMGDKTQLATVALAAQYHAVVAVVAGTTVGMLLADVPAVFLGERIANRIPLRVVRPIAAAIFGALGIATLAGAGRSFGI